jgi:hypothetical protein
MIQRKEGCACGGDCPTCQEKERPELQTKLKLGHIADPAEREADASRGKRDANAGATSKRGRREEHKQDLWGQPNTARFATRFAGFALVRKERAIHG